MPQLLPKYLSRVFLGLQFAFYFLHTSFSDDWIQSGDLWPFFHQTCHSYCQNTGFFVLKFLFLTYFIFRRLDSNGWPLVSEAAILPPAMPHFLPKYLGSFFWGGSYNLLFVSYKLVLPTMMMTMTGQLPQNSDWVVILWRTASIQFFKKWKREREK